MIILAGDIRGTTTSLALFERSAAGDLRELDGMTATSDSYPSPEDMLVAFVNNRARRVTVNSAAIGIAVGLKITIREEPGPGWSAFANP